MPAEDSERDIKLRIRRAGDRCRPQHLLLLRLITEEDLYAALSLQNNLPLGKPPQEEVSIRIARSLPRALAKRWKVLPFRILGGELCVAASNLPSEEMQRDIRRFSSLQLRVQLITPSEFEELAQQYLG